MHKETKDAALVGVTIITIGGLFYLVKLHNATPIAPDQVARANQSQPQQLAYVGPPSYNMPPSLTLPPFNVGNVPVAAASEKSAGCGGNCGGCSSASVCGSTGTANNFAALLPHLQGIVDTSPLDFGAGLNALPVPAAIVAQPQSATHAYQNWLLNAKDIGPHGPGLNARLPPGLTPRQIYTLYSAVHGVYLSQVYDSALLQSAIAQAYASPA